MFVGSNCRKRQQLPDWLRRTRDSQIEDGSQGQTTKFIEDWLQNRWQHLERVISTKLNSKKGKYIFEKWLKFYIRTNFSFGVVNRTSKKRTNIWTVDEQRSVRTASIASKNVCTWYSYAWKLSCFCFIVVNFYSFIVFCTQMTKNCFTSICGELGWGSFFSSYFPQNMPIYAHPLPPFGVEL